MLVLKGFSAGCVAAPSRKGRSSIGHSKQEKPDFEEKAAGDNASMLLGTGVVKQELERGQTIRKLATGQEGIWEPARLN